MPCAVEVDGARESFRGVAVEVVVVRCCAASISVSLCVKIALYIRPSFTYFVLNLYVIVPTCS